MTSGPAAPPHPFGTPSRRQTVLLVLLLALVTGGVASASYLVRPQQAQTFHLVHGTVFLPDQYGPVGMDLASGEPTLRLVSAAQLAGVHTAHDLSVIPLPAATLLLNARSGEFNMVDQTGFVLRHDNGVQLTARSDPTTTTGYPVRTTAAPTGSAYLQRTGPAGTDVLLINQNTVPSSAGAKAALVPRASIHLSAVVHPGIGSTVSAGGRLWTLTDTSPATRSVQLHRLSVPAGNRSPDARLTDTKQGSVELPAALTATTTADGSEAAVLAARDGVRVLGPNGSVRLTTKLPDDVTQVLPTSSDASTAFFLLHRPRPSGWSLLRVPVDGSAPPSVLALPSIPPDAQLQEPAQSHDALYTVATDGSLYQITRKGGGGLTHARTADAVPSIGGHSRYPTETSGDDTSAEAAGFGDAQVLARDSRVIVNSPQHALALTVFTDGSHAPVVARKSEAEAVSALAQPKDLAGRRVKQVLPPTRHRSQPRVDQPTDATRPITTRVDCRAVQQVPHVPQLQGVQPGSRSVTLTWTYPLLRREDCSPSSYLIQVRTVDSDGPHVTGSIEVNNQLGTTIEGLYPKSTYVFTVTALLYGQATTSQPVTATTGDAGPSAATGVTVSTRTDGSWQVTWNGCADPKSGCVPAGAWRIVPSFCDGRGVSTAPTPLLALADSSTTAQPAAVYAGSDALLGRGLRFMIEGIGADGQSGTPSAQSDCVYSTRTPDAAELTLRASTPDSTTLGAGTTSVVSLDLGADPVRAVGGLGAEVSFSLTGDGRMQTQGPFTFNGTQTMLSTSFPGVRAGADYTATAMVTPPAGGAPVSLQSVQVHTRARWPAVQLSGSCARSGLQCDLGVRVGGIASSAARGETFDFTGTLTCGNTTAQVAQQNFDPAGTVITVPGLAESDGFYGSCALRGSLSEHNAKSPAVFGGTALSLGPVSVDLGAPSALNASADDFTASWADRSGSGVAVLYTGASPDGIAGSWTETLHAPDQTVCGDASSTPTSNPDTTAFITLSADCLARFGALATGWSVTITYTDVLGSGATHTIERDFTGGPPGYQACTVTQSAFTAAWSGTVDAPTISVTYTPATGDDLSGCSAFSYQVVLDPTSTCLPPAPLDVPDPTAATSIALTCTTLTPGGDWGVTVAYSSQAGVQTPFTIEVSGDPPT